MVRFTLDNRYSTKIILLRHGESLGNAIRAYLGHTDLDLSPLGYSQAEYTAEFFGEYKVDAIYSSPLIRAYHTAEPHARRRNMPITVLEGVKEIYLGDWEGLTHDKIMEGWEKEFCEGWRKNFGTFTPPAGESIISLGERIFEAILALARENRGKTVLVATHAAAIRSFWGKISGISPEELNDRVPFPANCSFSVVYYDGDTLIPGEYSFLEHLEGNKYFDA